MAMYYYAGKLNEASCSGCHGLVPPAPTEPAPLPPPPNDNAPLPPEGSLIHGSGLSYYDNDDYYSMVRGNKFMTENACKHLVASAGLNLQGNDEEDEKLDIEYKDGRIINASLDVLLEMLRPGATKSFTFTFLLCARLVIKPPELLSRLCKRYFRMQEISQLTKDIMDIELSDMVTLVWILTQWTSMFPYDFRDERVMALVRSMTQRCSAEHMASVREDVSDLLEKLLEKLTALEKYEEFLVDIPKVNTLDKLAVGDVMSLGLSPIEMANQLTIVELQKLAFVGPEEFVQTFAQAQSNQAHTSAFNGGCINLPRVGKSTRNLEAYADWFNRLSYLVATDIIKSSKTKQRAIVLEQWVMTARECFNLGNFNSLMAIISALNMVPISRLKKTWHRTSAVCGQQLRQLELCIDPGGNHARYRTALAAAPTETAVPLLSVTCRDLHFTNQSAATKLPANRVNFEKCAQLARHVNLHLSSRRLLDVEPAPMLKRPPLPSAWRFLTERPTLTETALDLLSFEREPPTDPSERERFKKLRILVTGG